MSTLGNCPSKPRAELQYRHVECERDLDVHVYFVRGSDGGAAALAACRGQTGVRPTCLPRATVCEDVGVESVVRDRVALVDGSHVQIYTARAR